MWFLDLPGAADALDADNRWIDEKAQRDDAFLRQAVAEEKKAEQETMKNAVVWTARP